MNNIVVKTIVPTSELIIFNNNLLPYKEFELKYLNNFIDHENILILNSKIDFTYEVSV